MSKKVMADYLNNGDVVLMVENLSGTKATERVLEAFPDNPRIVESVETIWRKYIFPRVKIRYKSYAQSIVRPERLYVVATTDSERKGAL